MCFTVVHNSMKVLFFRQISLDSRNGDIFKKQEKKDKLIDIEKSETGVVSYFSYTIFSLFFSSFSTHSTNFSFNF